MAIKLKPLTENDFKVAAGLIGCDIAAIKAVYEVEAAGRGYLEDGRVKILFEGHRLWKILNKKHGISEGQLAQVAAQYPNVLYKKWDKRQYKGGVKEWDRMAQAYLVCDALGVSRAIAFEAASYGSFQIMGENYAACGYTDAQAMLAAYNNGGEAEQLNSFVRFVKANKLDDELRANNWDKFAEGYNGTAYRENDYHNKLRAAYKKFSK
jgi:hypothetical protein